MMKLKRITDYMHDMYIEEEVTPLLYSDRGLKMPDNTLEILREMSNDITAQVYECDYLNRVLINLVGGVSLIDNEGKYLLINQAYADACGYTPDEMVGLAWTETVVEEDLGTATKCFVEMLADGKASATFRGRTKNGGVFTKHITLIRRNGVDGQPLGHYCFLKT